MPPPTVVPPMIATAPPPFPQPLESTQISQFTNHIKLADLHINFYYDQFAYFLKRNFSDPIFSTMSKSPYFQILKNLFLAGPTWPAFLRAHGLGRAKALKSEPGAGPGPFSMSTIIVRIVHEMQRSPDLVKLVTREP